MTNLVPGLLVGQTVVSRDCLLDVNNVGYGEGVFDATKAYNGVDTGYETRIWAGTPLGMITSTKLWVPCKCTRANGAGSSATALIVDDARAFKVGDVISVGSTTNVTVTAIDYATNTLTIASNSWSDEDYVIVADGSQVCRGILNQQIDLWDKVTRKAQNKQFGQMVIRGLVDPNRVYGDIAAIRAATSTNAMQIPGITFGDTAGQYGPVN
ncbi:MAG: hypothetical protein KGL39_17175 [Patescibacteria group bacterium]|nr:hypothetical protein [Patescibacteria group bacterium]